MTARERAKGILSPAKLRQLDEAGIALVEKSAVERWEVEVADRWVECPSPAPRWYATHTHGATGRYRSLHAGDPETVEAP